MTIICNVTGSERKRLVQALGAILLWEPVYQGAPSFGYAVGNYTVDRNGTISCPESATPEIVAQIISKLTNEGFDPEISGNEAPAEVPAETPDVAPDAEAEAMPEAEATEANVGAETPDTAAKPEAVPPTEEASVTEDDYPVENTANESNTEAGIAEVDDMKLTVSIPREKFPDDAFARLRIMVSNKEMLFKRALLADDLSIEVSEDKLSFSWFTLTGMDGEAEAYTQFVTHLCMMAIEQTRVLDKPYDGDNDRFAMRIFMVRLGMKGAQFALARKLMMKNLTGNSGWRYGAPPRKTEETSVGSTEEPDAPIPDATSDMETAEESNTASEDISADSEPAPEEVVPGSVEAASTEDAPPDEDAAAGED